MMKTYARMKHGIMAERIDPMVDAHGDEIPIERRFHPDFVAQLVEIDPENPPPTQAPEPDWRPAAWVELRDARDRLLSVLSGIQSDYITLDDMASAALCLNAKQGLKEITEWPAVVAVALDEGGTREGFDEAVTARWTAISDLTPEAVKEEFARYGLGVESP